MIEREPELELGNIPGSRGCYKDVTLIDYDQMWKSSACGSLYTEYKDEGGSLRNYSDEWRLVG